MLDERIQFASLSLRESKTIGNLECTREKSGYNDYGAELHSRRGHSPKTITAEYDMNT